MPDEMPQAPDAPQPQNAPQDQGMQVQVAPTPPPTSPIPQPTVGPSNFNVSHGHRLRYIAMAATVVVVILAIIYFFVLPNYVSPLTSTISATTTLPVVTTGYLSSCGTLSNSGTYAVNSSIKSTATQGPCIDITGSNIAVICNGTSITGSGPFTGTGPFSYGILASGVSNVSVTGCGISNFSYAVYATSVSHLNLANDNLSLNYISSLHLSAVSNGTIENNLLTNSSSPSGAITITNGTTDVLFQNNTLRYNNLLGINLSSTNNRFIDNYITGSRMSFECTPESGFKKSNFASGNTCYNQTGCAFLSCSGNNIPINVSQFTLSPTITTCGSIIYPGSYSLNADLNMSEYSNASSAQLAKYGIPCIRIDTSKVTLNCNNNYITGGYAGVLASSESNITLNDCNVTGSLVGVLFNNVNSSTIKGSSFENNNVSVQIIGSSSDQLSGVSANFGTYGIYLVNSTSLVVSNFTANNNRFGLYLSNSLGNIFNGGTALNNVRFDVFGSPDSVNVSTNIMSDTDCNTTDTQWSTCKVIIKNASFIAYPISACSVVSRPGLYNLSQDIYPASSDCIKIESSNVNLNCGSHMIIGHSNTTGSAIIFSGLSNVTISNCGFQNLQEGITARNSTKVNINNINVTITQSYGVIFDNVNNSIISNSTIRDVANATILLNRSRNDVIINNSGEGVALNTAITIENSTRNLVINNTGFDNNFGIVLYGSSMNNTIYNNSYTESAVDDFYCSPQNQALTAENGGVNGGTNDSMCRWAAVIPVGSNPIACSSVSSPSLFDFAQSYAYYTGATCFYIAANLTTIDCEGHTVLATNGGTFALFKDEQGGIVENCFLKGFTDPVIAENASIQMINDTIYENVTGPSALGSVIFNASNSKYEDVKSDNFLTPYTALSLYNISYGDIENNNFTAGIAYQVYRSTSLQFTNDTSNQASGVGVILSNSTLSLFQNNRFDGTTTGIACVGTSQKSGSNTDEGGNVCSSNSGCAWLSCH